MSKINREEYEVLKDLDDKWKWIARDKNRCLYAFTGKPVKKYGPLLYWGTEGFLSFELFDEKHLFQFIQWEDEEPYNIAELIEDFEEAVRVNKIFESSTKMALKESEETEVKKDKEGLVKYLEKEISNFKPGQMIYDYLTFILKQLNQLDEPEVLSQEWIDNNSVYASFDGITEEYVHVDDLENLLVPTLSKTETVADVIADFFKSLERLKEVMSMEVEELEE